MKLLSIKPAAALNDAYRKQSLSQEQVILFKNNYISLFTRINENESEEHNKNIIADFLKDTYYKGQHEINTNERKDLVIHNGPKASDSVGVIIEAKKPGNRAEMITAEKPNVKALHELVHYYLHERIYKDNKEIKHLIVTNVYEWFVFDAQDFEKLFYQNRDLLKAYKAWYDGVLVGDKTEWLYNQLLKPFIENSTETINTVYFNLKKFEKTVNNKDKADDEKLVDLYKALSSEHLLKKPFANDSNSLNKEFYNELLHIIGLEEKKEGSKKLIDRKAAGDRNEGSLLENTINILQSRTAIGDAELFSTALELCINWLNRILFLKLMEGQLIQYHRGNKKDYSFLNAERIKDFDELDELFFEVLALPYEKRSASVNQKFGNIPYLNSSLFEPTAHEQKFIYINALKGRLEIPIYKTTVLKDKGKRISGNKNTLHYLFEFLEAYDFASDKPSLIKEDNKTIINASVLGLIFEKINGYKDGSFFTPGFITMYMCRETLRRAIVQKFKESGSKEYTTINDYEELKDKIDYSNKAARTKASEIINAIKICDPAVGSGHFLVSALNELIAIKSDLRILSYRNGNRISAWKVTVANDELIIKNVETDKFFAYQLNENNKPIEELQELQEALFHEKQTLIENCLFGVDINPKSVMICQLRLWIELLKNAYYLPSPGGEGLGVRSLETLPNIDINIKCGNSLISRFKLEDDLSEVFKSKRFSHEAYLVTVHAYKNAKDKAVKDELKKFLAEIKKEFLSTILNKHPYRKELSKLRADLTALDFTDLFGLKKMTESETEKKKKALQKEIDELERKVEEYKSAAIYKEAFEWRFEFPEVLDGNGNYVGFDVVIGNPPWGAELEKEQLKLIKSNNSDIVIRMIDSFMFFINLSISLKFKNGFICLIVPDVILYQIDNGKLRKKILDTVNIVELINLGDNIFQDVARASAICLLNSNIEDTCLVGDFRLKDNFLIEDVKLTKIDTVLFKTLPHFLFPTSNIEGYKILSKINGEKLGSFIDNDGIQRGVSPDLKEAFVIDDKIVSENNLEKNKIRLTVTGGVDVKKYTIANLSKKLIYTTSKDSPADFPKIIEYISKFKSKITCKEVKEGKHPFYSLHRERDEKIFLKSEKLVGVITGDKLIVALDNLKTYPTDGLFVFCCERPLTNKCLLALLNSKLLSYLYRLFSFEEGRVLAQIKPSILIDVPIIVPTSQLPFITLVDKILAAKKENPAADTSTWEKEIDALVYALYGLTQEEINLIEKS